MRTNIVIDDDLMKEAMTLSLLKTKKDVMDLILILSGFMPHRLDKKININNITTCRKFKQK